MLAQVNREPRNLGEAIAMGRIVGIAAGNASARRGHRAQWNDEDQEEADDAARLELHRLGMADEVGDPTDLGRAARSDPRLAWPAPLGSEREALLREGFRDVSEMQRKSSFLSRLPDSDRKLRRDLEREVQEAGERLTALAESIDLSLDELLAHANARMAIRRALDPMRRAA